jgi:hypothetical protein
MLLAPAQMHLCLPWKSIPVERASYYHRPNTKSWGYEMLEEPKEQERIISCQIGSNCGSRKIQAVVVRSE